jgi:cytochrome c oxidase cbb3-type subunit III
MLKIQFPVLLYLGGALVAQQTQPPAAVIAGTRLYRANCASCHGPNGDLVPGVDLGRGRFRTASSDESLVRIIRNGIPGSPMPPANLTEFEAGEIVAYLRYEATRTPPSEGDATRGRAIFEGKGACLECHRVGNRGSRTGPDLSDIGSLRRSAELQSAVVEPGAEVLPQNRTYRVVTRGGETITGRLLNLDTFSVQLMDSTEQLRSLLTSDLREHGFVNSSPMPSYRDKLTAQELADLTAYLAALR